MATNGPHHLQANYAEEQMRISPLTDEASAWSVTLSLTGFGYMREVQPTGRAQMSADRNRVSYSRPKGFVESYVNAPEGFRQRFVLEEPPRGDLEEGPVPIEFELALSTDLTTRLSEDGRTVAFASGGEQVLFYTQLQGTDAAGREVPARMELVLLQPQGTPTHIRLLVEAMESVYPITVEALIVSPVGAEKRHRSSGSSADTRKTSVDRQGIGAGEESSAMGGGAESSFGPLAPPSNDQCSGALVIPAAGPFPYMTTTVTNITDATTTGDPPAPSCQSNVVRSIWYTFTPTTSAQYTISDCADAPTGTTVDDTVIAVYTSSTGACGGTYTEQTNGCDDDSCSSEELQSIVPDLPLTAGVKYFIIVWQYGGVGSPTPGNTAVQLRIERFIPPAPPANDNCAGATVIPDGPYDVLTSTISDITGATVNADPPAPSCNTGLISRSIWYLFTPGTTAEYTISSCASATSSTVDDTLIGIYTSSTGACGGTYTEATDGCDDDSCTSEDLQAVVTARLQAGTHYFIVVWKDGGARPATGDAALQLRVSRRLLNPPANNTCGGAQLIPDGPYPILTGTVNISDADETGDPPLPSCQTDISRSVWYLFTPGTSDYYTISTCADAPTATTVDDTAMAIYTSTGGCGGTLSEIPSSSCQDGCDDDSCGVEDRQSVVSTYLTAGTAYYVVVWSFGAAAPTVGNTSLQLRVIRSNSPAPPANDGCSGAETIPGGGPFPYTTTVTSDIRGATCTGDPPSATCGPFASRSIWYRFTPAVDGSYTISSCLDAPTGTTVDDTVMAVYTSSGGCAGTFTQVGCDGDGCTTENLQSVIPNLQLTAATTYYIVLWQQDTETPSVGHTAVQLRVSSAPAPGNDQCASAIALSLDAPVAGTTIAAGNDYQLSGSGCFTGVGQTASTAAGRDVSYSFTAPSAASYSFRVTNYNTSNNLVLYVASSCAAGAPPVTVASCLGAANRAAASSAEEVMCQSIASGQKVYVYVDENTATTGSAFKIEANRCDRETEPNNTPATASSLVCGKEGSIGSSGEADFFSLGTPATQSRVFAVADGVAANSTDFDMRVTTSADTLEYDDLNNDPPFGSLAPNVGGTKVTGAAAYIRMSHFSTTAEPYRLYAVVQPPSSSATPETEPNGSIGSANTPGDYFSGTLPGPAPSNDVDVFRFVALANDLIVVGLESDPLRDNTPINTKLELLDSSGSALVSVNDPTATSSNASGSGSLTSTTPNAPAEGLAYRVAMPGTYYVRVSIGTTSTSSDGAGDYLLSISPQCLRADADSDGAPNATDCARQDATVKSPAVEVTGVTVTKNGAGSVTVAWTSQDPLAGSGTRYDMTRGSLTALRTGGYPGGAVCASDDLGNTPYTETSGACAAGPGQGCWYLVRAENSCGIATYGAAGLDSASPCLP